MTMFHIILIEFDFNSFNATCDFNIEACSFKKKNIYGLKCLE